MVLASQPWRRCSPFRPRAPPSVSARRRPSTGRASSRAHDLVWKRLPYALGGGRPPGQRARGRRWSTPTRKDALAWELGRTDVADPRIETDGQRSRRGSDRAAAVETAGALAGCEARLDLWNAEATADGRPPIAGTLTLRGVRARRGAGAGDRARRRRGERGARFVFHPELPIIERAMSREVCRSGGEPEPGPVHRGARPRCARRCSGGRAAASTSWPGRSATVGARRLFLARRLSPRRRRARRGGEARPSRGGEGAARSAPHAPGVLARLLPAELRVAARHAARELLLDPDVQAGLGHARRSPGHRHAGALVPPHAVAGHLVEPEHPAQLLAGVRGEPPRARRVAAGGRRSQPARTCARTCPPPGAATRWRWGAWAAPTGARRSSTPARVAPRTARTSCRT